jgi:hypothetical protein
MTKKQKRADTVFASALFSVLQRLFLSRSAFGCLERVDFLGRFRDFHFDVGGGRTFPGRPLALRIGIDTAVIDAVVNNQLIAAFALVDDCIAASAVVPAALLRHEGAFASGSDGLADHTKLAPFSGFSSSFVFRCIDDNGDLTDGR